MIIRLQNQVIRTQSEKQFAYVLLQLSLDKARNCTLVFPAIQAHFTIHATTSVSSALPSKPPFL